MGYNWQIPLGKMEHCIQMLMKASYNVNMTHIYSYYNVIYYMIASRPDLIILLTISIPIPSMHAVRYVMHLLYRHCENNYYCSILSYRCIEL